MIDRIIITTLSLLMFFDVLYQNLFIMQQQFYEIRRYLKYYCFNKKILFKTIINLGFSFLFLYINNVIVDILIYFIILVLSYFYFKKKKIVPLKITNRIKRIIIVNILALYFVLYFSNFYMLFNCCNSSLIPQFSHISFFLFTFFINKILMD